jgi:hypothetical protein
MSQSDSASLSVRYGPAMRTRGIVVSLLAAVVLLPAGARAEPVVVGSQGVVTRHATGMPTAGEPWRILVTGSLDLDSRADTWQGSATLGGPVPAGEKVTVSWIPGIQRQAGCEPLIQLAETVTTLDSANTVSVERPLPEGFLTEQPTCLRVTAYSQDTVSDELVGEMADIAWLAGAQARPAAPLRVAAGRVTPVLLMVTSHVRGTSKVAVSGSGPGVRMRDLALGPVPADRTVPVVARIRAPGVADSELVLTARDDLASTSFDQGWEIRAREITARRPVPGTYESSDGSIAFRLTDDHRVVRLRTSDVLCERSGGTHATYPVEIPMPRSGATAVVAQLGSRWFGAQLLTRKPTRVQGTFAYTTPTCQMSLQFVARLQR